MPILEKSWFVLSLRTGCIVVAGVDLCWALIVIPVGIKKVLARASKDSNITLIAYLVVASLTFIASGLLMFAIAKANRMLTVPWQVMNILCLPAICLLFDYFTLIEYIIYTLVNMAIIVYMGLVVFSYYQSTAPSTS